MARAIAEEMEPDLPDEHYASICLYVPDGPKGRRIIEEITTEEQSIYKEELVSDREGDLRLFKFDCTLPSQMYVVAKVGTTYKQSMKVTYPNGHWLYLSSSSIASNEAKLNEFKRYCKTNNLASVKYRKATAYQFAFNIDDLYLLSRYFAKTDDIYGKFYASEQGVKKWKGRPLTKLTIKAEDLLQ